jgi:SAM-dependent methyltransferase
LQTYQQAVHNGHYVKDTGGLVGKHDNVRRYWEDELTGLVVRDALERLLLEKKRALERLHILDLGCGSGEGYELLTNIRRRTSGVETTNSLLVTPELVGLYLGVDISQAMVDQGRETYRGNGKVVFEPGDLREGLPSVAGVEPFDLYFSSYGSLSHLNDQELENLLVEIAHHASQHALAVVDVLGKFSYEWQEEWDAESAEGMRDYSMAYLHPDGEVQVDEIEHFPMRYWNRQGLEELLARVSQQSGRSVTLRRSFDRSILVGRHMDTALYNPKAPALRRAVNTLHESNHRTDLRDLLFDYHPKSGFDEANRFFERVQMAWNLVVSYCIDRLASDEMDPEHEDLEAFPEPVAGAVKTIAKVIDNVRWMRMGDPRANIIEPQLAYALRSLEVRLQQGQGYAHGLVSVVEIAS